MQALGGVSRKLVLKLSLVLVWFFLFSARSAFAVPSVTLTTSPSSGQCLEAGSSYSIGWSKNDEVQHVALSYSLTGATDHSWNIYHVYPTSSSPVNWSVPNSSSSTVKITLDGHDLGHTVLASDFSAIFKIDCTAPGQPGTPTTTSPTNDTTPAWSWGASTDNVSVSSYEVYWSQTPGGTNNSATTTSANFTHSAALAEGTWYFKVRALDGAGNQSSFSANGSVVIDTTPPSTPGTPTTSSPTSDNTPTWSWTASTDNVGVAKYQVCWAQTQNCTSVMAEPTSNSYTHTTALSDGTWYFRAKAVDAANNASGYSGGSVVIDTTPPPPPPAPGDTTPPSISFVFVNNIGETTATISWTTNESATSQAEYGLTVSYVLSTSEDSSFKTSHSVSLSGLAAGATYHFRVKSKDASGNLATSSDATFKTVSLPDKQAPIVSSVTSNTYAADTQTINISWMTNEPATSQIEYGETESLGQTTAEDGRLVTNHTVQLTGIAKELVYYFKVRSRDAAGNSGISALFSFDTKSGEPVRDESLAAPTLEKIFFNNQEMAVDTIVLKVTKEDTFILVGKTFPFAKVKLYAASVPRVYETLTNGEGAWMVTVAAADFEPGEHKVEAEAETKENKLTRREEIFRFEVVAAEEEKKLEPEKGLPAVVILFIPVAMAAAIFGIIKLRKRFLTSKSPPSPPPPPQLPPVV